MARTASLVFFYFGEESYMNRLAQETVPLAKALRGYDHAVLLRHETTFGPFELSEAAEDAADVIVTPTRENLAAELNRLGQEGYDAVDVFIFSHGWDKCFRVSAGSYGDNTKVCAAYLENNVTPLNIRMVWQCNCWGATLNPTWRRLGAQVAAGARFVNFYPTRFKGFIRRWHDGVPFSTCLNESDTKAVHTPVQAYMMADAAARAKQWDGNAAQALTVLSKAPAAERYFTNCWIAPDEWRDGRSGKQNMNFASRMLIDGNRKLVRAA